MDLTNLTHFSDEDLLSLYPKLLNELKNRNIIRTNNFIGDYGEYLALKYYNNEPTLPNLQDAPISTKNVDALSRDGERYAIKSTSTTTTGNFSSIPIEDENKVYFEYLIVVKFDRDYVLEEILEFEFEAFKKIRKVKKPENRFFVSLTSENKKLGKLVYSKS